MLLRPVDSSGDILPVLSSRALLTSPEAVARLVEYRLGLLVGEWWENKGMGFSILEVMQTSRITEDSASALASMISAYIRETPGVQEVEDARFSVSGRRFCYSCMVRTGQGSASVSWTWKSKASKRNMHTKKFAAECDRERIITYHRVRPLRHRLCHRMICRSLIL